MMQNIHILKELAKNITLLYVEDNEKMREQASIFFKKFFKPDGLDAKIPNPRFPVALRGIEAHASGLSFSSCCRL